MVYPCFFFRHVGDQTQTSTRPLRITQSRLFAKSCWNLTLIHGKMLQILLSLLYVKYIFFSFYRSIGFEENIKYAKNVIASAMECADAAAFTFAT